MSERHPWPETGKPGPSPEKCQTLIYRGNFAPRFAQVFSKVGFVAEQFPVGLLGRASA